MLIKILMVLLIVSMAHTEWRWANDTAEFKMDKEAHLVGSAGAYFFFRHKDFTEKQSILYSFYLGLAKETIDALVPYEVHGRIGGDGFSKYDLAYNLLGIGLAYVIDKTWEKKDNENKSTSVKIYPGYIRFDICFN